MARGLDVVDFSTVAGCGGVAASMACATLLTTVNIDRQEGQAMEVDGRNRAPGAQQVTRIPNAGFNDKWHRC